MNTSVRSKSPPPLSVGYQVIYLTYFPYGVECTSSISIPSDPWHFTEFMFFSPEVFLSAVR
jgi:hypothetical protein